MSSTPTREFSLCILGSAGAGKTSLCERLSGKAFSRKAGHRPTLGETATKFSVELTLGGGGGIILVNLYDWAWAEVRRDVSINDYNQQLMRGPDGFIFLYDVQERKSKTDWVEFNEGFSRAAGFDKPQIICSNKNDSKKAAVTDAEGKALAAKGDRRAFVPISLVDDTGIDELVSAIAKIFLNDLNAVCTSYRAASEEALRWSEERLALKMSSMGLSADKAKRVVLVAMNAAVIAKFTETFADSELLVEALGSPEELDEMLAAPSDGSLPIVCLLAPPTASAGQQDRLRTTATGLAVPFVVSIPKGALEACRTAGV